MRVRRLGPMIAVAAVLLAGAAPPAGAQDGPTLEHELGSAFQGAGAASGAYVEDLGAGRALFARRSTTLRMPASVEKLYTTSTAILRLGAGTRLETTALSTGVLLPDGTLHGDLVLRGGGDPSLGAFGLGRLARTLAEQGVLRIDGDVLGDESLFDVLRGGPRTSFAFDSDVGGVLGALTVARGWSRSGGPAVEAARRLAAALKAAHVKVAGRPGTGVADPAARTLATYASPTIAELVRSTLVPSDNFYAETLLKDVGARAGQGGSTVAGAAVVRQQLGGFGLQPRIADGSGLSRQNRTSPEQVVGLLRAMHDQPDGPAFESAMAVAGRTGTVRKRLRGTAAAGRCRTKTGTLRDVSALAGICATTAGRTVAFAFLMNRTAIDPAKRVQDRMTATLARYSG